MRLRLFADEAEVAAVSVRAAIRLERALLCAGCDALYEMRDGPDCCPACGSGQAMAIARALNRPQTEPAP